MTNNLYEPAHAEDELDGRQTGVKLEVPTGTIRSTVVAPFRSWLRRPFLRRLRPLQVLVVALATIPIGVIGGAICLAMLGVLSLETLIDIALGAGENPGLVTFGAMFLATPIQRFTGRTQIRVRKYLGIVFFLLAASNGAMFVLERGFGALLSAPFLVAGTVAVALSIPLFVTSNRRAQTSMGIRRWRLLHKLTYAVAVALLAHVILVGDLGPGAAMITLGFVGRIPFVGRWLERRGPGPGAARSASVRHRPVRTSSHRSFRRRSPEESPVGRSSVLQKM